MAKTISELKAHSQQIKDASEVGENTATRIGNLFGDVTDALGEEIERAKAAESANATAIIGTDRIANLAVTTDKIAYGAVTGDKIATGTITEDNIQDKSLSQNVLADDAVSTYIIQDGAVTTEKLADSAMSAAMTKAITDETARAKAAEEANAAAIVAEAEARDITINNEAQARAKNDQQLNNAIVAETERAKAAEEANATSIIGTDRKLAELDEMNGEFASELTELKRNLGGFSQKETDEDGLYICDQNGNVIIRLDILDTKSKIGDCLKEKIIEIARKSITPDCVEDGFYICNENGETIAQYKNNAWELLGLEVKDRRINPCYSSLGLESGVINADSLSNSELVLMDYPKYLKRNVTVSFGAKISTFSQIKVGVKGSYFCQAQIDSTYISIVHNTGTIKTEAHGLNISGWIDVALKVEELNVEISVHSLDGYKKITATLPFRELYGRPTIEADENTTLTDISLRGYCDDFQKSIWFVGDSYTSCTEVRWTGQMLNFGIKNWMLLGLAGGKSKDLYEDLLVALKYGTPAYLVWCMGMNDADSGSLNADYKKYFELVKSKCGELGIIMIPATVPCVKTSSHPAYARDNSYKNAFIKASSLRYIDLAKAVGGDTFMEDAWYDGYLETTSPWIHTSELGAKAQAAQIIRDFPEILRNK